MIFVNIKEYMNKLTYYLFCINNKSAWISEQEIMTDNLYD